MASKILLADDNLQNRFLMQFMLKNFSVSSGIELEVLEAVDGQEVIERYEAFNPKVILMDLKMPRMDGWQATGLIKRKRPDITIIAVSAQAMLGDREKAIASGCDDYIAKPVDRNKLESLLLKYLNISQI
jgi:two-component system cell cycle response regulator DivK